MLADAIAGETIAFKFKTSDTLSGSPVVSIYKAGSTTESVAGVSLTADFDSRTGLNSVVIDTAADAVFYSNNSDYDAVITAGEIQGASVAGDVVWHFRLALPAASSVPAPGAASKLFTYKPRGWNQAILMKTASDKPVFAVDFSAGLRGGVTMTAAVAGTNAAGATTTNIVSSGISVLGRHVAVRLNTGGSGGSGAATSGARFKVRVTATGSDGTILTFDVFVFVKAPVYNPS